MVKDIVCYEVGSLCNSSSVPTVQESQAAKLSPSVGTDFSVLKFSESLDNFNAAICGYLRKKIRTFVGLSSSKSLIHRDDLSSGIYFVRTSTSDNSLISVNKLIFK